MKTLFSVCLLLVLVSGTVNAADKQNKRDKEIEKALIEQSKKMNENLPTMVNSDTRLEATMVFGKNMHFKYTMVKASSKDINKEATTRELKTMLVNNQCNTDVTLNLLKMGVTYQYMYQDKDGNIITIINISKKDCGK